MNTQLQELALTALSTMADRRARYDEANKAYKWLNPDFPQTVTAIDPEIETALVKVLDEALGDEIASYFLFEVQHMKGGGNIVETNGTEWPIASIEDVRAYVARPQS